MIDCPTCADYFGRRALVLAPELEHSAAVRGVTVDRVVREYAHGVHQRHLAGLSLDTSPAPAGVA